MQIFIPIENELKHVLMQFFLFESNVSEHEKT